MSEDLKQKENLDKEKRDSVTEVNSVREKLNSVREK